MGMRIGALLAGASSGGIEYIKIARFPSSEEIIQNESIFNVRLGVDNGIFTGAILLIFFLLSQAEKHKY